MHSFHNALNYIDRIVYAPNELIVTAIQEERQNSDYAAGRFELSTRLPSELTSKLSTKTVRFRVAKQTPTKVGQFVTFWEKDTNNTNQPYQFDTAPDLLVVSVFRNNVFKSDRVFGQFVFPKNLLLKKGIIRSDSSKGKMAIRVYPSWDKPMSKTAINTQLWQLDYFFEVNGSEGSNIGDLPTKRILELYAQ